MIYPYAYPLLSLSVHPSIHPSGEQLYGALLGCLDAVRCHGGKQGT